MTSARPRQFSDSKPKRQRGFSLWEMAVLLGMLGVAIVAGFALLKSERAHQIENERMAQLSAADRALTGFITEKGRLPCPDTTGNGLEDCGGTAQKGWLPVITLGLSASAPARGVARLSYIVYRGAGADLTVLAGDRYNPLRLPTLLNGYATSYAFNQINTLDFCVGLTLAASATPSATSANIPGAGGAPVNIAYAVAESGIDTDGDGNLFDGLDASTTSPVLESPARASDIAYDDIVKSRSFYALGDALKCPQATRSVDAVAHAVEVSVTVTDFRIANTINAGVMTFNAATTAALNITSIALGVASLIAGAATLTKATAALTADTAACAACVVGVGCPACAKIPFDTAAIGFANAGLILGAAAVSFATTVGTPLDLAALAAAVIATAKAGVILVVNPTYPPELLTEMQKAAADAATRATQAEADAVVARSAATAALTSYNSRVNSLYTTTGASKPDPKIEAALDAYKTYSQAALAYHSALADAQAKRKEANDTLAAAIAAEADAAANPTDVNKQKTAVDLRTQATNLAAAATQAENDANNVKKPVMDNAYSDYLTARATAIAAYPSASSALDSAVTSYDNYMNKDWIASNLESNAVTARNTANDLQAAYIRLRDAPPAGTTTGGPALSEYSGAEAILRASDLKGALQ